MDPEIAFILDSLFLWVFCDLFYLVIGICLMGKDLPTIKERQIKKFYVSKPRKLEPRSRLKFDEITKEELKSIYNPRPPITESNCVIYVKPYRGISD